MYEVFVVVVVVSFLSFFFFEDSNNGGFRTLRIKLAIAMNDVDSMPSLQIRVVLNSVSSLFII